MLRKQSKSQVFRITGARQGLDEDVRGRQRRYVISMSIRTVSVILAVVLWNVARPVAIVALVLGFVLPYIAVVIANAGRENAPSKPSTFVSAPTRPMLGAHTRPEPTDEVPSPPSSAHDSEAKDSTGPAGSTADPSWGTPQDHG
ncbi:DUF3099 domain-containing protein [Streptomyces odontomachi]|uniref:DUF3099 domain-containing protein n=1 Tax=Streptomyces odontomachi TaxID=2944940 RepID=UPI0035A87B6E